MRAYADTFLFGALHNVAHGERVAGMHAAGDARGTHDLEHGVVVADAPVTEPLAHVRIQVYHPRHASPFIPHFASSIAVCITVNLPPGYPPHSSRPRELDNIRPSARRRRTRAGEACGQRGK